MFFNQFVLKTIVLFLSLSKIFAAEHFFKRITLEEYDQIDRIKFDKVNEMRLKAGYEILQYSDRLMVLAQSAVESIVKAASQLSDPIPKSIQRKVHARALKYIGEITTTGYWLGSYKCFDNFLDIQYKAFYSLSENCLTSSTLFTEYGYGRMRDSNNNLFVVQLYSFTEPKKENPHNYKSQLTYDDIQSSSYNPQDDSNANVFVLKYTNKNKVN